MIDTATLQALSGLLAVWLAAIGLLVGFVYWHYRDLKHEFRSEIRRLDDKIDHNNAELLAEIRRTREEMKEEVRLAREEMKEEVRLAREEIKEEVRRDREEMKEEMRRGREEMLAEMRRNHVQLLAALNGHTHDTGTGAAVFHEIPTAADD